MVIAAKDIRKNRLSPVHAPRYGLRIRIDKQLRRVKPQPFLGLPRSMHAIAVSLARLNARQIAVPNKSSCLPQRNLFALHTRFIEKAKINPLRLLRIESKVHACSIPLRAKRVRLTRKKRHWHIAKSLSTTCD